MHDQKILKQIHQILNNKKIISLWNIVDFPIIQPSGLVDINFNTTIGGIKILKDINGKIPIRFGNINGFFDCSSIDISSLEGAPIRVTKGFSCSYTKITSLEFAPKNVLGNFDCSRTNITSLEGLPQDLTADLILVNTKISSLDEVPESIGKIFIAGCIGLKLQWDDPKVDKCYINSDDKGIIYHKDLPLLRTLDPKFTHTIWYNNKNETHKIIEKIMEKYIRDTSMPLYEKQMRCQHELLGYPEYRLNAKW